MMSITDEKNTGERSAYVETNGKSGGVLDRVETNTVYIDTDQFIRLSPYMPTRFLFETIVYTSVAQAYRVHKSCLYDILCARHAADNKFRILLQATGLSHIAYNSNANFPNIGIFLMLIREFNRDNVRCGQL
jgi:hypothetical protein